MQHKAWREQQQEGDQAADREFFDFTHRTSTLRPAGAA
jgi:hypothetical protein